MANIFDYVKYTDNWQKKTLPKIERCLKINNIFKMKKEL